MQEELKAARAHLKVSQADLASERHKSERKDQDVFTAQYEMVGVQEKLTQALTRIKIVEEERDALKTTLKEEEVARIAAQGQIALPPSQDGDDEFGTPIKTPRPQPMPTDASKIRRDLEEMRSLLELEQRHRVLAQEQVDFMKMECQFGCCSCRIAESRGSAYVYDDAMLADRILPNSQVAVSNEMEIDQAAAEVTLDLDLTNFQTVRKSEPEGPTHPIPVKSYSPIPSSEQFSAGKRVDDLLRTPAQQRPVGSSGRGTPAPRIPVAAEETAESEVEEEGEEELTQPETPGLAVRTVTHTTTIPLVDESTPGYSAFFAPGSTLTREEALERIRERRGRARSVTGTPKRSASAARTPRRDISAPEHGKTPRTTGKPTQSVRR